KAKGTGRGTAPQHLPRPPMASTPGRECAEEACSTLLSIYDILDRCWQHTEREPLGTYGHRVYTAHLPSAPRTNLIPDGGARMQAVAGREAAIRWAADA